MLCPAASIPGGVPSYFEVDDQRRDKLGRAISTFNYYLTLNGVGALAQAWLPAVSKPGSVVLNTQGLPFSVSGHGDLLALFRCLSCRYKFSTDVTQPSALGAVGRVFVSGEPEMSLNVQAYNARTYLRVEEAKRCRVHSTLIMPLFESAAREHPFAVFEVCQTEKSVMFPSLVELLRMCCEGVGLYIVDIDKHSMALGLRSWPCEADNWDLVSQKAPPPCHELETHCSAESLHRSVQAEAQPGPGRAGSCEGPLPFSQSSASHPSCESAEAAQASRLTRHPDPNSLPSASEPAAPKARLVTVGNYLQLQPGSPTCQPPTWREGPDTQQAQLAADDRLPPAVASGAVTVTSAALCRALSQAESGHEELEDEGGTPVAGAGEEGMEAEGAANNRVGGGAGKRLTLAELQSQFGVGLREAAANLRICPTTLKRACRRHGIRRWPRRHLAKLSREAAPSGGPDPPQSGSSPQWEHLAHPGALMLPPIQTAAGSGKGLAVGVSPYLPGVLGPQGHAMPAGPALQQSPHVQDSPVLQQFAALQQMVEGAWGVARAEAGPGNPPAPAITAADLLHSFQGQHASLPGLDPLGMAVGLDPAHAIDDMLW